MASLTKIIEFYGIPACGKTTLVNHLIKNNYQNKKVGTFGDVYREAKQRRLEFILSFNLFDFTLSLLCWLYRSSKCTRKDVNFKGWFYITLLYRFALKSSAYEIVLVDHGLVQEYISINFGSNIRDNAKQNHFFSRLIGQFKNVLYVSCELNPAISLSRMKSRGRNVGVIDVIDDDDERLTILKSQKEDFNVCNTIVNDSTNVFYLDSSVETINQVKILESFML